MNDVNTLKIRNQLLKVLTKVSYVESVRVYFIRRPRYNQCKVSLSRHRISITFYIDRLENFDEWAEDCVVNKIISLALSRFTRLMKATVAVLYSVLFGLVSFSFTSDTLRNLILMGVLVLSIGVAMLIDRLEQDNASKTMIKVTRIARIDGMTRDIINAIRDYVNCIISKLGPEPKSKGLRGKVKLHEADIMNCRSRVISTASTYGRILRMR